MEIIAFIALSVALFACVIYNYRIKKQYIKKANLGQFFQTIISCSNHSLYFKDCIENTEYLRLTYNNNDFDSLDKFLAYFDNTTEILLLINNISSRIHIENNIVKQITSKDKNTTLELHINQLMNINHQIIAIGILFYDISTHKNMLHNLSNELYQIKSDNQLYLNFFKNSPYIIWKENNKKITIISDKFKNALKELQKYNLNFTKSEKLQKIMNYEQYLNINGNIKLYQLTKIYKNNSYLCFAHDVSQLGELSIQLNAYKEMLPSLIQNLPLAALFIDMDYKIISWNNIVLQTLALPMKFFSEQKNYWEMLEALNTRLQLSNYYDCLNIIKEENFANQDNEEASYYLFRTEQDNNLKQVTIKIKNIGFILMLNWERK